MPGRGGTVTISAGLLLAFAACTPLPQARTPREGGTAAVHEVVTPDSIPVAWGSLVAANRIDGTALTELWFQDDSGTVRVAAFDHQTRQLVRRVVTLHRN